jgi:hypothetical protein
LAAETTRDGCPDASRTVCSRDVRGTSQSSLPRSDRASVLTIQHHPADNEDTASPPVARVLVVLNRTAASSALLDVVRSRATRGAARFHLLVPNPAVCVWPTAKERRNRGSKNAEYLLCVALPLVAEAAGGSALGSVSHRHDPMDAIEETQGERCDEIILCTIHRRASRALHIDLPRRVAHFGLPVTNVFPEARPKARASKRLPRGAPKLNSELPGPTVIRHGQGPS